MMKTVFLAGLVAFTCSAQAVDIPFTNPQFDVNAVALADGPAGVDAQSSPPSAVPVVASAASVGAVSVATAGALGAPGLLTSSADVSGGGGIVNAVGTAHFSGSFLTNASAPILSIDFTSTNFAVGTGEASTSLFLSLTSGGVVRFNDFVSGPSVLSYLLTPGATNLLDLTLTTEVDAGFITPGPGNASSLGQVAFTSAVPEPGTGVLCLLGLGAVAIARRKRASFQLRGGAIKAQAAAA
jgi:hypothetical protein